MYPSPIPEIQGTEKLNDMAQGQFLYTTASSPQASTLQASPSPVVHPTVVQIPQNLQQSFAADAALGLQFQMSSESQRRRPLG